MDRLREGFFFFLANSHNRRGELVEDTSSLAEAILEQIADAVIFADATGTIRRWNRAAALFGSSAAEALGQ